MSTARTIVFLLQAILVSVGVKSACLEEDCTGQAIIVVDPSSRECVSCFPCPQCEEGQTPSVPCASTVPQGTDIHCVLIEPSYSLVSTLVFSWHASITRTSRQITATTHTHEHPTVSATSSKDYAGSSSSITVDTESNDKENTGYSIKDHFKMGNKTVVYLFCGVSLPLIFLGILFKLKKSKTTRSHQPIGDETVPSSSCSSMTGVTLVDDSVHSTVHLHPDTNKALFSQSYTNNGQQDTPERNENNPFQLQHNQTFHDENGIPSSLEDNNAQAAPQQFFTATLQNGSVSEMKKQITQRKKYRCKMNQVPFRLLHKIYLTLDIKRADGRDVREFASKLNIPVPEFERLQREAEIQRTTTTSVILAQQVPSSWTVGDFVKIMTEMERADIIELINEWE